MCLKTLTIMYLDLGAILSKMVMSDKIKRGKVNLVLLMLVLVCIIASSFAELINNTDAPITGVVSTLDLSAIEIVPLPLLLLFP